MVVAPFLYTPSHLMYKKYTLCEWTSSIPLVLIGFSHWKNGVSWEQTTENQRDFLARELRKPN